MVCLSLGKPGSGAPPISTDTKEVSANTWEVSTEGPLHRQTPDTNGFPVVRGHFPRVRGHFSCVRRHFWCVRGHFLGVRGHKRSVRGHKRSVRGHQWKGWLGSKPLGAFNFFDGESGP